MTTGLQKTAPPELPLPDSTSDQQDTRPLLLLGNPNVGKSVLFNLLSGKYAVVSNYPGTTVELSRSHVRIEGNRYELLDTPGANSLLPNSEDEQVTARLVLASTGCRVLQVADAKNISRALMLTVQLSELAVPMVLALNMWDEARDRQIKIDYRRLADQTGIPVVRTVATERRGLTALRHSLARAAPARLTADYPQPIEQAVKAIEPLLPAGNLSRRGLALMALGGAGGPTESLIPQDRDSLQNIINRTQEHFGQPLSYVITQARFQYVNDLLAPLLQEPDKQGQARTSSLPDYARTLLALVAFLVGYKLADLLVGFSPLPDRIGPLFYYTSLALPGLLCSWLYLHFIRDPYFDRANSFSSLLGLLTMRVRTAIPLIIVTLWLLYVVVGQFAAGTCVDFLGTTVFGEYINPALMFVARLVMPADFLLYELLFDPDAGLITVGLTYSVTIVLPIVSFFFLAFGLLEDSGYFPRLAAMLDRVFKCMGLSGKAVLPMVLGLGCGTMATLTTRVLETRKQRTIAILLLTVGVPCSAQLGVIAGVLSQISGPAFALYVVIISSQLLLVGYLASRFLPGPPAQLIMEIPPFRAPKIFNVLTKTGYRVIWFLKEAVPLFVLGTFILFVLTKLNVLEGLQRVSSPVITGMLGLPAETTRGFLLGFLRRDYGAVSILEAFNKNPGSFNQGQVLVALVVITLFVPCIAHFFVMIKEKGLKVAGLMVAFVIPFAVLVGTALRGLLALVRMLTAGVS